MKNTTLYMVSLICCWIITSGPLKAQNMHTVDLEGGLPKLINIKDVPGHVLVKGGTANKIEITVQGFKPDKETSGLQPLYASGKNTGLGLAVEENNDEITISGITGKGNQQYTIIVPESVPLKMIWNGEHFFGKVRIENHRSDLEIKRVNGEVTLTDVTGPLSLYTMDAVLEVAFTDSGHKGPVSISTFHSDIKLKLPSTAAIDLKMRSGKGELFSAFEIEDKSFEKEEKDDCVDCVPRVMRGKLNGGGIQFTLTSYAGNIYLIKND